jgi:hypothetical protein
LALRISCPLIATRAGERLHKPCRLRLGAVAIGSHIEQLDHRAWRIQPIHAIGAEEPNEELARAGSRE